TFRLSIGSNRQSEIAQQVALYDRFIEQAMRQPGVDAVAVTTQLPFAENNDNASMTVEGRVSATPGDAPSAQRFAVSADYFGALTIPILRGRAFNPQDAQKSEPVAILNQTAARILFGNGDALDHRVQLGGGDGNPFLRMVGVALVAGLAASVLLGRFLSALLFGVANGDPVTLTVVAALLAGASLVACAVPALRAARIEPIRALHEE